jgi:heme A synthase
MNVGDLVIVNVPPSGEKHWPGCHGVIVEKKVFRENDGTGVKHRIWCYVLRGDTGKVEKFHENWMAAQ